MMFKPILYRLAAAAWLFAAAAVHAAAPQGRIYDTQAGREIAPETLVQQLKQADVVLIGEKHDEAAHHNAEAWLLAQTAESRQAGSVLLEMLDASQQRQVGEVQAWMQSGGKTTPRRLNEKMGWNNAWQWQDYSTLVHFLMGQKAKVLAANPERAAVHQAASFVPQGKAGGDARVREALGKIMGGNHGSTDGLVSMQQFKDHTMAQNLIAAPKPAWMLAGAIHTSKQLGVPLFLRDAGYGGKVKVVILADPDNSPENEHGDFIWYVK